MSRRLLSLCFLSFLTFIVPALVLGQSYTASVRGTITDPSQAGVPSATVTLTEVEQNVKHTTATDTAGRYAMPSIPPGQYILVVEAPGFKKATLAEFRLEVQQEA